MGFDLTLLDAVIDRIIPADADPGAQALGTPRYVRARLAEDPALQIAVADGLADLPKDFERMKAERRDGVLREVEHLPWFATLVELTQEGFWADPGNGGNDRARSWDIIGYRHGLPEGPMGPAKS